MHVCVFFIKYTCKENVQMEPVVQVIGKALIHVSLIISNSVLLSLILFEEAYIFFNWILCYYSEIMY